MKFAILVTVSLAAVLAAFPAIADDLPPIQVSGQFRTRAEGNHFNDFASDRAFFTTRLRTRFSLKRDAYDLVFTPQFAKTLGSTAGTSGTTTDPSLLMHEAFGTYHLGSWDFTAGRMILSYGDELIIGALEWNNIGRAFDGFKLRYRFDPGWVDFFATKLNENSATAPTSADQDFYGVYTHIENVPAIQTAELYVLDQKSGTSDLYTGGFRTTGKHDAFDHRFEATIQTGNGVPNPKQPFQADGDVGYKLESGVRFAGGYFVAGPGYSQLYPTVHKWLGIADVLGRRNLRGFRLIAEVPAGEKLKARLDYHRFERFDSTIPVYKLDGATALGSASGSSSGLVGNEFDLTLTYQADGSTQLQGGASLFLRGDYLRDQFRDRNPTFFFVQVETKF